MKSRSAAGAMFESDQDVAGVTLDTLPEAPTGGTHAAGAEELQYDAMVPRALDGAQYHEHPPVLPATPGRARVEPDVAIPTLEAFARVLADEMRRHLDPIDAAHAPGSTREAAARRIITGNVTVAAVPPAGALQLIGTDPQRRALHIVTTGGSVQVCATMAEAQNGSGFTLPVNTVLRLDAVGELYVALPLLGGPVAVVSYIAQTGAVDRVSDIAGPAR